MDGETGIHGRAAALNAGRLIRDRRNARGLDQEALGALLGKSQAQIESWESGADLPTEPSDRYALDQALDLDVESSATLTQHILEWAVDRADNATRAATRTMQAINVAPEGIFVVHGHDEALKNEVASFLAEATPDKIVILSEEPNRGRTIIEKFERHAAGAKFAVVLMTPDD